ncbi:GAF domain-containing protein [Prauserella shujinwangii]|uniref:GAF domain-containing protein n=1 Tax=Prauserella shujinwangii TaxID=1453103 RepID=A0A2T0M088_9PSEU|nr:helix-turn-helix domain-containing protein [Prauserella shujinwangii]PRX50001.1 GAF domain-containing protein [Prauserella shujinwangii]
MAEQPAQELLRDPESYARLLKHVHEAVLSGAPAPRSPRSVVSESWNRSLAASVDPDSNPPPVVYGGAELAELRESHPLAPVLPILRRTLVSIADDAEHIMIVTDAEGYILWREGATDVCRRADRVHLAEGTRWSEDAIGTNAMGTTLATGKPVQIYSAEHLVRTYHAWTCAAAPLRDPETGALLGAIDVSGPLRTVHPAMLALVSATADLAEGHLRTELAARDERLRRANMPHLEALRGEPGALLSATGRVLASEACGALPATVDVRRPGGAVALPDGRIGTVEPLPEGYLLRLDRGRPRQVPVPRLTLEFLGDGEPMATVDGRDIPITLRHAEILTLLALHPEGLSAERLALQLYGEAGNPVTVRAELHRLRNQLGPSVFRTRPYRLAADIEADFLRVRSALREGAALAAARAFEGPLLPRSEAPAIHDERESITALVRRVALEHRDPEALWEFWDTSCGADDLEVVDALCTVLPGRDPRRALVETHRAQLEA